MEGGCILVYGTGGTFGSVVVVPIPLVDLATPQDVEAHHATYHAMSVCQCDPPHILSRSLDTKGTTSVTRVKQLLADAVNMCAQQGHMQNTKERQTAGETG